MCARACVECYNVANIPLPYRRVVNIRYPSRRVAVQPCTRRWIVDFLARIVDNVEQLLMRAGGFRVSTQPPFHRPRQVGKGEDHLAQTLSASFCFYGAQCCTIPRIDRRAVNKSSRLRAWLRRQHMFATTEKIRVRIGPRFSPLNRRNRPRQCVHRCCWVVDRKFYDW